MSVRLRGDIDRFIGYLNKHCTQGGLVVFEDIDAMTQVVHKRCEENVHVVESTLTELVESKNRQLTLEYFLNVLQGSLTQDGTIFVVTTNHLEHLDPAFYRDGRFDVKIEMQKCDVYQMQTIYKQFMKRSIPEEILERIPEKSFTPATFIFHVKNYMWECKATDEEILSKFFM